MARFGMMALVVLACAMFADMAAAQGVRGYYQALQANGNHKLMMDMINSNALYRALLTNTEQSFTVFAPTDKGFESAARKYGVTVDAAKRNTALLMAMLQYHVVPNRVVRHSSLSKGIQLLTTMYRGMTLRITNGRDRVTGRPVTWVNSMGPGVRVVKFDQLVASPKTGRTIGVIHDINGVLLFDKDPSRMLAIR